MTGGIDNDNEDEDACNKDVSPFSYTGWEEECLLFDSFVHQIVENNYEKKRNKVQQDGGDRGYLYQMNLGIKFVHLNTFE